MTYQIGLIYLIGLAEQIELKDLIGLEEQIALQITLGKQTDPRQNNTQHQDEINQSCQIFLWFSMWRHQVFQWPLANLFPSAWAMDKH